KLRREEERTEPDGYARQSVDATLLAVYHADRVRNPQAGLAERRDRLDRRPARGHHVLDQADALAPLERALDAVAGAVALRLAAPDREGGPGPERRRGGERTGAELGRGEPDGSRLVLGARRGNRLAEQAQQVGPRDGAVLVEVVGAALPGTEDEV